MAIFGALFLLAFSAVLALPYDPEVPKLDNGLRYQYERGLDGEPHLVDSWMMSGDLREAVRYNPDQENVNHLFTRQNPTISQPILLGGTGALNSSNFDPNRRTIVLVHGMFGSATDDFNSVLVPAFLAAEDVNVFAVDWSAGAFTNVIVNAINSGHAVARFIKWANEETGASIDSYHVVGFSLGGHQSGVIGRDLDGKLPYITCLDPANQAAFGEHTFSPDTALYTEVIHTSAFQVGYGLPVGDVDFYPNGGVNMPGCGNDTGCDHARCYFYLAESLTTGGFTGTRCETYTDALAGACDLPDTLQLGGLEPKTGSSGSYYLQTNAWPPFSRD